MSATSPTAVRQRIPWNKGKLIGPKPPLQPKHVWSIRARLQLAGKISSKTAKIENFPAVKPEFKDTFEKHGKRCSQGIFPAVARAGMMRRHEHGSFQS